jgi:nucleotide-binding universal stress UspA family protein
MGYRNVIVGTDGSETAELAVRHAATLAKAFGARLTIVTAYAPVPAAPGDLSEVPEDLKWRITDSAAADERAESAQHIAKEVGVKEVRRRTSSGDPATAIIEVAEDTGGDLIVVGSKGMSSPSRFVLGSVPNKVSHHTPCDVMIVHTAK